MAESSLHNHQEDIISELPEDVLVRILSLLTVKESGRTSSLSHRWRNLWKFTGHLKFFVPLQPTRSTEMITTLRSKYVTWVNQVLRSHKCCSLDRIIIYFDLDASYSEDIDEWIKLMIVKRAKNIWIDLKTYKPGITAKNYYSISKECNDFFKSVSNLSNITCLRNLVLRAVNIDGELIEYLLSNCPHLNILSISESEKLFRLKVSGPSLPLKHLEIWRCNSLDSIELCAPNLASFCYSGKPVKFILGRNPHLSFLSISGAYSEKTVIGCLPLYSSYFLQIQTLSLGIFEDSWELPQVKGLRNLKHLTLYISSVPNGRHFSLTEFIMEAQCLAKLTFKFFGCGQYNMMPIEEAPSSQPHKALKEVEITGYIGAASHLEFWRYLFKSAINLEKVVLNQHSELVVELFEQLKRYLPVGAELIIL